MAAIDESNQKSEIYTLYQARMRAEEIDFMSREQHRIELQKLIDVSNEKVAKDFEQDRTEIDHQAKISFSLVNNEQRISILKAQRELLDEAIEETRRKLLEFKKSSQYEKCLLQLLIQGIKTIDENEVTIHVVNEDNQLVDKLLPQALQAIPKKVDATLSVDSPLSDKQIGGVLILNSNETIRVDNTLEGRLLLAAEGALPQISSIFSK